MTIESTGKEVEGLIKAHSIYGIETIINAVVRHGKDELYVTEDYIIELVKNAYKREKTMN